MPFSLPGIPALSCGHTPAAFQGFAPGTPLNTAGGRRGSFPFCGIMALAVTACGGQKSSTESVELTGAGATFPLPFYNMSFEGYSATHNNTVSYGGIGSGGGVRNLKDGIVDFAGSDAFLSDKEMSEMDPVVHIPTCMGAVVLAYNLPDVVKLNLSGDVIADIYAGKITDWNDARLQELNPDVKLWLFLPHFYSRFPYP